MRDSEQQFDFRKQQKRGVTLPADGQAETPFDPEAFFTSFYRANVRGKPEDRVTIGAITEMESRFHYNAVENSIIRAMSSLDPPPSGAMVEAWRMLKQRSDERVLDIGSGTGHWIDFMRNVFHVRSAVGCEIAPLMFDFLTEKYADVPEVEIVNQNIAADDFDVDSLGGMFDYVTAIGVMFHIVDDDLWRRAVKNLAVALKPSGIMLVGGEFGLTTRNVEFHKTDEFDSWKSFEQAEDRPDSILVNKRTRSLGEWLQLAADVGLQTVDIVRTDRHAILTTPENDVLILQRPG